MKRIPCAFVRHPETGLVTSQPAVDWFAAGYGVATRKWDGIPYLIDWSPKDEAFIAYRGARLDPDAPRPLRFIQTSDAGAPELCGWMAIGDGDEAFMTALEARALSGRPPEPGAYELCGPGIKGNHERFPIPTLVRHDLVSYIRTPRTLDHLIAFLLQLPEPGEGLVWTYGDQSCQLTRQDVGLPWPSE